MRIFLITLGLIGIFLTIQMIKKIPRDCENCLVQYPIIFTGRMQK